MAASLIEGSTAFFLQCLSPWGAIPPIPLPYPKGRGHPRKMAGTQPAWHPFFLVFLGSQGCKTVEADLGRKRVVLGSIEGPERQFSSRNVR